MLLGIVKTNYLLVGSFLLKIVQVVQNNSERSPESIPSNIQNNTSLSEPSEMPFSSSTNQLPSQTTNSSQTTNPSLPTPSTRTHTMITRSQDGTRKLKSYLATKYYIITAWNSQTDFPTEPSNFKKANKSVEWYYDEWV